MKLCCALVSILKERGTWQAGLRLAETRKLLQEQAEVQEQGEWLQEIDSRVDDCLIDYYPKFHCEFNFIELYWGQVKRYSRPNCDYSFAEYSVLFPRHFYLSRYSLYKSMQESASVI